MQRWASSGLGRAAREDEGLRPSPQSLRAKASAVTATASFPRAPGEPPADTATQRVLAQTLLSLRGQQKGRGAISSPSGAHLGAPRAGAGWAALPEPLLHSRC